MAAILGNAHILRDNAPHCAFVVEHHFIGGETGEDHHAQRLCLLTQPAGHIAQRSGIAAIIAHQWRHHQVRHVELCALGQRPMPIVGHRGLPHGAIHIAPFRKKLIQSFRVHDCAGKNMRADFRALFQYHHFELFIELFQPDCRR